MLNNITTQKSDIYNEINNKSITLNRAENSYQSSQIASTSKKVITNLDNYSIEDIQTLDSLVKMQLFISTEILKPYIDSSHIENIEITTAKTKKLAGIYLKYYNLLNQQIITHRERIEEIVHHKKWLEAQLNKKLNLSIIFQILGIIFINLLTFTEIIKKSIKNSITY